MIPGKWPIHTEIDPQSEAPSSCLSAPERRLALVGGSVVLALAALFFFTHLNYTLLEPDEGRYAEIPRLMVLHQEYLTPKLEGKPYNDKPPLVYWLVAAGYHLFGTEVWVGRAVCALAGWLTLVVIYLWSCRTLGVRVGLLAVGVLCTMLGFVVFSRMLLLDSVLSFLVIAGWLAGHHAISGPQLKRRWWMVSAAACGLGVLAKGPVAVVLILPVLFAYRWLDDRSARWGWRAGLSYLSLVALIGLPWYLIMIFTNEGFAAEHFWRHHIRRFLDPVHHKKPLWFYGPAWLVESMPWTGVALLACWQWRSWQGPQRFCAFGSIWLFCFFSASSGKLPTYLLPLLPLNGVIVASFLDRLISLEASSWRWPRWLLAAGLGALIVVIAVRGQVVKHFLLHEEHPDDFLVLLAVPLTVWLLWRNLSPRFTVLLAQGTACFLAGLVVWHVIPDHARQASKGEPSAAMAEWGMQQGLPVVAYRGSWQATSFYLDRAELKVFHQEETGQLIAFLREQPKAMVLLRPEKERLGEFLKALPGELIVERLFNPSAMAYGVVIRNASTTAQQQSDRPVLEPIASRRGE